MPMIWGAYKHNIQVFFGEHFSVVGIQSGLFPRFLAFAYEFGSFGKHIFIHVTKGNDLHIGHLDQSEQVAFSVPSRSDQSETYRFFAVIQVNAISCLLYTSPSPRDGLLYRMPSSA